MKRTIGLMSVVVLGLSALMACDKKTETAKTPTPDTAKTVKQDAKKVVSPKTRLDEGMASVHLQRLTTKFGCESDKNPLPDAPWCAVTKFTMADKAALPKAGKFPLVGLTIWVPTKGEIDPQAVYPATFAYRADENGKRYGDVVRIKNRSKANANHVKGMVHQVKQVFAGKSKSVLLTEQNLFGYLKRRAAKAKYELQEHRKGWQVKGGNDADIRKVGDMWVSVHVPNLKKGEAEGIHVSIFKQMDVTNKVPVAQDVAVDKLAARLNCANKATAKLSKEAMSACEVIEGFKAAKEINKPKAGDSQLFVGSVYRVRGGTSVGTMAVQTSVGDKGRVAAVVKGVTGIVKGTKGAQRSKVVKGALALLPAEVTRQSGDVSRVHQAVGVFESHPQTKTYSYMRQDKKALYIITRDPMGGLTWYGALSPIK